VVVVAAVLHQALHIRAVLAVGLVFLAKGLTALAAFRGEHLPLQMAARVQAVLVNFMAVGQAAAAPRVEQAQSASFGVLIAHFHRPTRGTCKWNILTSNSTFKSATVSRTSTRFSETTFAPHFLT
jgi:hypothetical protein